MASSRKPPPPDAGKRGKGGRHASLCNPPIGGDPRWGEAGCGETLSAIVEAEVRAHVRPGARIAAALSGGVDSVVLLDVLARAVGPLGATLSALHVHHGLSPNADDWLEFCRELAAGYGISFHSERVNIVAHHHHGPEGAARAARHAAFARADCDWIALAHHQDDQAETVLLQLLRGAGVAGLAAMPAVRSAGTGPSYLRPLLGVTRADIEAYARARGLRWIEDESNEDVSLDRNRIRHHVLPRLRELRPDASARIARSAGVLAEAVGLLDSLAAIDEVACLRAGRVDIERLAALDPARARNLLRYHLGGLGAPRPEAAELTELWRQLTTARCDAQLRIDVGDLSVRRYDGLMFVERRRPLPAADFSLVWRGEARWPIPELGIVIDFESCRGEGLAREAMERGTEVRLRTGGERLRLHPLGPRRALKDLLQEARVPPWERMRLPLVYCGGEFVCAPGIGVDVSCRARAGEQGLRVHWRPLA